MTPWARYQADLERPEFVADPAQATAMRHLQALHEALIDPPRHGLWQRLRKQPRPPVKGLYLWGGVGRGKTYMVDTFYDCLPFENKRRLHFHRFMQEVHRQLKQLAGQQDPLPRVAAGFAAKARIICFDEFFVSDIADAMLLAGLLSALFERGVTLVATSNIAPDLLYRDGLQRQRFLPAIRLIKQHTTVLNVDGGTDYRLRYLEQARIYHVARGAESESLLEAEFGALTREPGERDVDIEIEGRLIRGRALADGVIWFDFRAICDGPRSQADYIEVAREFHTVLVSGIPQFDETRDDQARRFIAVVDEFYDHDVKLICTAAAPIEQLYVGQRLSFAFQRTVSRLQEMQSREYLARPHRP